MHEVEDKTMKEAKLEKYYIAYFDVLGYKAFFEDNNNDVLEFLASIVGVAKDVVYESNNAIWDKFEVKSFSDNFVILLKDQNVNEYQAIKSLSYLLALMQLKFLERYRVLIRGGITTGDIYIDKNIIFGEGLIKAVELESNAIFPRIILDEKAISRQVCDDLCEKCIKKDNDDRYYIDLFEILDTHIGNHEETDGAVDDRLIVLQNNVFKLLKKYGKYNSNVKDLKKIAETDKTISKYIWLLTKYNEYCIKGHEKYKITYDLKINMRLMKTEIIPLIINNK